MPAASPAADTKKPATPPPSKAGAGGDRSKAGAPDKAAGADKGGEKAQSAVQDKAKGAAGGAGDKAAATGGQQRFDRMAVRAKLAVSEPGDAVEREADAVADKVMRMPEPEASAGGGAAKPAAGGAGAAAGKAQAPAKEQGKGPAKGGPGQEQGAGQPQNKPAQIARAADPAAAKNDAAAQAKPGASAEAAGDKQPQQSRPQSTGGTHGGLATESVKPEIARAAKDDPHAAAGNDKPAQAENKDSAQGADADSAPEKQAPTVPTDFADKLGSGTPLDPQVRASFEQRMGCDLSAVRVHTDDQANVAAKQIQARAFTFGRHIAFAAGEYQPDTPEGKRLLAHELAHVQQQRGDVVARMVMRAPSQEVKGVTIPSFKFPSYTASYTRPAGYDRGDEGSKQMATWLKSTKAARDAFGTGIALDAAGIYVAVPKGTKLDKGNADLLVGSPKDIGDVARKPRWDDKGTPQKYDVDHLIELQIGGPAYDNKDNLQLRDASSNRSSGASISASIDAILQSKGKVADLKRDNDLVYSDFKSGGAGGKTSGWKLADIENQKPGEALNIYDPDLTADSGRRLGWPKGVDKEAFFGGPDLFVLYPSKSGGAPKQIALDAQQKPKNPKVLSEGWIPGVKLSGFDLNLSAGGDTAGKLTAVIDVAQLQSASGGNSLDFTIKRMSGKQAQAGYINTTGALTKIKQAFNIQQMSPVEITELDLLPGTGLMIVGVVNPTLGLIKGVTLDLIVQGKDLRVEKTFNSEDLKIPGPFKVNSGSLRVALGSESGFSVTGTVNFGIDRLGEGSLVGIGKMSGFAIKGNFEFDKKLFDAQARVGVSYVKEGEEGKFSGEGDIKIGKKIKGISSASAHVSIDGETFNAKGTATTDIPGIKSFGIEVNVDPKGGASITGDADLGSLPGVDSAKLKLKLDKAEGGADWKLSGEASGTPKLAGLKGLSGSFAGKYDDGLVLIQGKLKFDNGGVFSGSVDAGVTNGSVDDAGKLTGKEVGKKYSTFGTAEIDAKFSETIKGKATVRLLKDGSVRIKGRVTIEEAKLFERIPSEKESKKTLFDMTTPKIPVPGLAISVGGIAVGLNVSVKGGLYNDAWIGPGTLAGVFVEVAEFNPEEITIETMKFNGGGKFIVPAYAGISAGIDARLTLDAGIASVGGSVGMVAEAGIKPKIEADAKFTWSKNDGLDVKGEITAELKPVLSLSLNGKLFAEANIIVDTITLWEKQFDGPTFEFDPKISAQAKIGGSYNSKKDKAVIDPPVIEAPKIDVGTLMGDVMGKGNEKVETHYDDDLGICFKADDEARDAQDANDGKPADAAAQPGKPKTQDDGAALPTDPLNQIGSGVPLDIATRGYFEQRMKADLARVQIHTGPTAAREAKKLSARAFTVGDHIAFAEGEYDPDTPEGQELIAHELAHLAQMQGGGAPIVMRWPAVTRTDSHTTETPATIRAKTLSDFILLTQTQLDWATSPALQADAAALGQFRDVQTFADGPNIVDACGDLGVGAIIAKGIPGVSAPLKKYTEGSTGNGTAWLRHTNDLVKAERWGTELTTLEGAWSPANLSLVMRAPDPVASASPFERLEDPGKPELANFIAYLGACTPVLSADNGSEVDSFLKLRDEGVMPQAYKATVGHVTNYHHLTKLTLDGLADNEAFPQWKQKWSWFQRPLTVVLYPAIDHNGAFHRNLGLQEMVTNTSIVTIVIEGMASVANYQAELAPVAARYGISGEIQQAMIGGHGNATILQLAGTAAAAVTPDTLGTTGTDGTNTTNLMTELTRLMSSDPKKRRIVLDACLTNSHHVASALRASPADAAADVNAAVAANPSLRDFVAGVAGAGANVFGSNSSFAPAQTTFMTPGGTDIGLSVPGDPDLIASKVQYVEFGTEPEGCMRAVLECWATDQIAGTHNCRDAVLRRIGVGRSAHIAAPKTDTWRESIIQPLYDLAVNNYWGNGDAIRQMGGLASAVFELYWAGHTTASGLNAALAPIASNAAHVDKLFARVSAEPHYAATPRVAVVIEQAWMQHTPARQAQFLTALGRYTSCQEAKADVDMGMVMGEVPALLTVPPVVPPPADQLRLALMAAHHAPVGSPPPSPLPVHAAFLRSLLGPGPTFPAPVGVSAALGGMAGESDILADIGRPIAGPPVLGGPPSDANIDTVRDPTALNDFHITPLRSNAVVSTVSGDLMVRSTPTTLTNSNIFNRLPTLASVKVVGEWTTWYAIEQPARTGFVAKQYIALVP
jgi:Domain of unknown function (DUF4157)